MSMPAETTPDPNADKRRAKRSRCLREARCVFNKGCSNFSVLVRNISETGARLAGSELFCLPEEFELQIINGPGSISARRVRRMWIRQDSIGVFFLEPERAIVLRPLEWQSEGLRPSRVG
jgi:PilZ domain